MDSEQPAEVVDKCDKATNTNEDSPSTSSPVLSFRQKSVSQPPRNISPIPEGSRSHDSSLPRHSSAVSDSEAVGGGRFRAGLVIAIFSVHWLVSIAIFVVGLVLTLVLPNRERACHVYFLMVYLRAAYWLVTYLQHDQIKRACQKLINQNYNLYLDMVWYRKAPLLIVSIWNMVLLAVQSYVQSLFMGPEEGTDICAAINDYEDPVSFHKISPQMFMVILCGLETIALGSFHLPVIVKLISLIPTNPEDEEIANQTLSNQDEFSVNQRLKRQAEQVKVLRAAYLKLKHEAFGLGVLEPLG